MSQHVLTRFAACSVMTCCLLGLALCSPTRASEATPVDLSGTWQGHWDSHTTGHNGPLEATLIRLDEWHYQADFSGRFFKIVPFRYSVVLEVVEEGDVVRLAGESYLGRLWGTFHYEAVASATDFTADYSSCRDCGQFVLKRCCLPVTDCDCDCD